MHQGEYADSGDSDYLVERARARHRQTPNTRKSRYAVPTVLWIRRSRHPGVVEFGPNWSSGWPTSLSLSLTNFAAQSHAQRLPKCVPRARSKPPKSPGPAWPDSSQVRIAPHVSTRDRISARLEVMPPLPDASTSTFWRPRGGLVVAESRPNTDAPAPKYLREASLQGFGRRLAAPWRNERDLPHSRPSSAPTINVLLFVLESQ